MPKIITVFGYCIYIWTNEGKPLEPIHVHVNRKPSKNSTKVWINHDGTVTLANNDSNIPANDLKRILPTIESYSDDIITLWKEIFNEDPVFHDMID